MLIECILKLKADRVVDVHGTDVVFKNKDGKYVAEVEDQDIAHRLLQIREGYRKVNATDVDPVPTGKFKKQVVTETDTKPKGAPIIIKNDEGESVNLSEMALEDIQKMAREDFGLTVHYKWSVETIAAKIVEAMRVASES